MELFAAAETPAEYSPQSSELTKLTASTLRASKDALNAGIKDGGISFVFYLLTQIALSARRTDPRHELDELGIHLSNNPSTVDLTIQLHGRIDDHFQSLGIKSDVAEMAQLAAGETLAAYFREQPRDLFSGSEAQLFSDLYRLGNQKTFGSVARQFFANFMSRMLGFYLSKFVLPGGNQRSINNANDLSHFNSALKQHAFQRAAIIHDFAEKWFSKTEFERGIDPQNTKRFVAYACKKLEAEFMQGMDSE